MRRFLGVLALAAGASLLMTTTLSANDPEGRVVNTKPKRTLKKLADSPRTEPTPAEPAPVATAPTETAPTETTPIETTPIETTRTETTPTETARTEDTRTDTPRTETTPSESVPAESGPVTEESAGEPTPVAESTPVRTFEEIQITEDEKRRAAAGKQAAAAEEQLMSGRVRGLQLLIAKEEQLLAQRLAYAGKLREKGLAANDQKTLDQAEQFERAALAEYLKKVQQFERTSVTNSAPEQPRRTPQPPRTSKNPTAPRR